MPWSFDPSAKSEKAVKDLIEVTKGNKSQDAWEKENEKNKKDEGYTWWK